MKLQNVNSTDIADAIALGCRTMSNVFNADDNDIAFFASAIFPWTGFGFSAAHSESHIPGRHLNALLNAEDVLGVNIPDDVIEKHARAAYFSYGGPVLLPLNRAEIGGSLKNFYSHNVREGFHALYALTAYRGCQRASDLMEASIAVINELWDPQAGWDRERLQGEFGLHFFDPDNRFIPGLARAIGPLVKYYRVTKSPAALQLALVLKDKAIAENFLASGECDLEVMGSHSHSITSVLSSLAQLAETTRDAVLMERVKVFYEVGLKRISNELGWSPENTTAEGASDRGEANNTGDILETALILGRWGYTEYYDKAERILRGHLLPCQLRDTSFIPTPDNPDNLDCLRDVANRHLGAFGFPAPYGHQAVGVESVSFNMDIVGGVVGSLCEALREATRFDADGHRVNLLFDHETEFVKVESPYPSGEMKVTVKKAGPLMIRLPGWATRENVEIEGAAALPSLVNGYLYFANPTVDAAITIRLPLPRQELNLTYLDRVVKVYLEGDCVTHMDNLGADYTFFDVYVD